jgi:hypothetical protein
VSDPSFALAERRSFAVPIAIAVACLAIAMLLAIHFFPVTTVAVTPLHTELLPTHTVYKSNSIVLGQDHSEDVLFVAETLHIDNKTRNPVTLDGFHITLTDPTGAQLTQEAVNHRDLPGLETTFPAIKPLEGNRLNTEAVIQPGQTIDGTLLFSLPIPQTIWDSRKDATIQLDLYHLKPVFQVIPKA